MDDPAAAASIAKKSSFFLCLVCGKNSRVIKSTLFCSKCNEAAHLRCTGIVPDDAKNWMCDGCSSKHSTSSKKDRKSGGTTNGTKQPSFSATEGKHQAKRRLSQSKNSAQPGHAATDSLDSRVAALPDSVTSRFGELCWAQGGSGYSWWPSMIFDPRRTEDPARSEGNRHLGTKHLVYFLECPETPFICLYNRQIKPWIEGYCEDFHIGKAAKACGKQRLVQFQRALLVANHAIDLPPDKRMDLDSLSVSRHIKSRRSKQQPSVVASSDGVVTRKRRQTAKSSTAAAEEQIMKPNASKRARYVRNEQQDGYGSDESKIMCMILLKRSNAVDKSIGMVFLSSVENSTFSDVRQEIEKDLCGDLLPPDLDWRFYLPQACVPVSKRQETSMGSFYNILTKESDGKVGNGTFKSPVKIFITEV